MASSVVGNLIIRLAADIGTYQSGMRKAQRETDRKVRSMQKSFDNFDRRIQRFSTSVQGAFAAIGGAVAVRAIANASQEMQRIQSSLEAATGSSARAAKEFAFVRQEADRLGLDLKNTAKEYASLTAAAKGTALEGQATRDIFIGVSEAATALGLTAEQTGGALNAIQQMISKGSVQAEELRGQLGERLPGAFQLAAKSMGKTTAELSKMLEQGEVAAEDLLPKLAQGLQDLYGDRAAEQGSKGLTQALNRLNTAFFEMLGSGNVDGLSMSINNLADKLNDPEIQQGLQTVIQGIVDLTGVTVTAITKFADFGKAIGETFGRMAVGAADPIERIDDKIAALQKRLAGLSNDQVLGQLGAAGIPGADTGPPTGEAAAAIRKQIADLKKQRAELASMLITVEADTPETPNTGSGTGNTGSGNKHGKTKVSEAEKLIASMREQVALYGELSKAEEARISLANGFYGPVTEQQEALIMQLAREYDARVASAESTKKQEEALENLKGSIANVTEELQTQTERSIAANESRLQIIANAIERNLITEQKANELRAKSWERLADDVNEKTNEMSAFAEQAARNIQDELGDTLRDTLSGDFDGILDSWTNMLLDMAAQAQAAQLAKMLLGDFGADGGKGKLGGLLGTIGTSLAGSLGGMFGGGGVSSASAGQSLADAGIGGSSFGVPSMFGPGRANGGAAYPNTIHPINERGIPEVLTSGGRDYLMMGSQSGYVTPAQPSVAAPAANSAPVTNVSIQTAPGLEAVQTGERQNSTGGMDMQFVVKAVKSELTRDIAQRGDYSRAQERTYPQLKRSGS